MRPAWQERDAEEERRNFEHRCRAEVYAAGEEIYQLEQRLAEFEELAKRAAELVARLKADGSSTFGVVHDLAEMHKEANNA